MPACFQLYRKADMAAGPVVLQKVDEELCEYFKVPCDEKRWMCDWYNTIGFRLAIGKDFEQIREEFRGYVLEDVKAGLVNRAQFYRDSLKVLEALDSSFTANSFYSPYKD